MVIYCVSNDIASAKMPQNIAESATHLAESIWFDGTNTVISILLQKKIDFYEEIL